MYFPIGSARDEVYVAVLLSLITQIRSLDVVRLQDGAEDMLIQATQMIL